MTPEIRTWVGWAVRRYEPKAPVLEIGSLNVNGSVRDLFDTPYTGMDIQPGEGVDIVHDATIPFEGMYNTVVSCETLEHTPNMTAMMKNIANALLPNGIFICTVPWLLGEHNYPQDYWRVSRAGLRVLMEEAGIRPHKTWLSDSGMWTFGVGVKDAS